ncbi:TetR family transcriptional regulator [Nocardia nova]|uniref:TetR family transcriptional regulator n=1 Tax=Nocardia nova TaxID=37330 RepID=A0A2S6AMP6_9NOCA|nr:TetR/AcrR family transcriptional regulator [Nocardia nova]PPJ25810.1 TetR family transcriptional regulator [Nocardia nova]PPJ36521.1 TetR family transcriptional regulator [Nocardia nova]
MEERVVLAALQEYGRTGWSGFTMDAVARRAGVGKSTLYLRWPSKEALIRHAIEQHSKPLTLTDSGSLREDITALATNLMRYFLDPAGWASVRITMDEAAEHTGLDDVHGYLVTMHSEAASALFQRAIEGGELSADAPIPTLTEALYGTVLMHILTLTTPERAAAAEHIEQDVAPIVELLLATVAAHATDTV